MAELTQPAVVLSTLDLTPHVRQLVLRPLRQKIVFQPGQWVSLKLPVGDKPPLNRAYSMADPSSPYGELTLVFDRVPGGISSNYLYQLKSGDEIPISGPYGNFVLPMPLDRELLFIARYTGL
ncbi:MAG: FAD-binding oxidoreductase, partial [Nitrospirota bacterium]